MKKELLLCCDYTHTENEIACVIREGNDILVSFYEEEAKAILELELQFKEKIAILESRIEELEMAINCATIISWDEKELPDSKLMIILIIIEKVQNNLKKVKVPWIKEMTYYSKLKEAKKHEQILTEGLKFYANPDNYKDQIGPKGYFASKKIGFDKGLKARTILKDMDII